MLIFGSRTVIRKEEAGEFDCPRCATKRSYYVWRTYEYWHIYFIPLLRQKLLCEQVTCEDCRATFPLAFLAGEAREVATPFEAGQVSGDPGSTSVGNVVSLTESAAHEIFKRRSSAGYGTEIAIRFEPIEATQKLKVGFDMVVADGTDWIGSSHGLVILVDRRVAPVLLGRRIDFRDGEFRSI